MHTLTQCNENKQQNEFETVAGTGAVINDSLEIEPPLFELYDKSATANSLLLNTISETDGNIHIY